MNPEFSVYFHGLNRLIKKNNSYGQTAWIVIDRRIVCFRN